MYAKHFKILSNLIIITHL